MNIRMPLPLPAGARLKSCAWVTALSLALLFASGPTRAADSAGALRAHYDGIGERLADNPFKRPLTLDSVESPGQLSGEIHALVSHPFAAVRGALNSPAHWCDVLILHLNTKSCRVTTGQTEPVLTVHIGRKEYQELAQASRVDFGFRLIANTPEYLQVRLAAAEGPFGTSQYRILLQAIPVDRDRTFLQLRYSYEFGTGARLAMQAYLATLGRDKIGFTVTGKKPSGEPVHIAGMRGALERNTMRYYLAIDAYLGTLTTAPADQIEKRLTNWFTSTEQYPQLHEVSRVSYMDMKRREIQRQQTGQ